MGRPISIVVTLAAAVANSVALSQTPSGAGNLTINGSLASGGVATLDAARRVIVTSAGNDSGRTFTITGTDRSGQALVEAITGAAIGAASSTQDFATVTQIAADAATAGAVTAGTSAVGSGPWVPLDVNVRAPFLVSVVGQVVSGSPTWQLDYTYDDVFGTVPLPTGVTFPRAIVSGTIVGKTGTFQDLITAPVRAIRLTLTVVGGVSMTVIQQGD